MPVFRTPVPGKFKIVEAMLPEGAKASKAGVSAHLLPIFVWAWAANRLVIEEAKDLILQIGPPTLPPN